MDTSRALVPAKRGKQERRYRRNAEKRREICWFTNPASRDVTEADVETVVLTVHVVAGCIAMLCGFAALAIPKGSTWHRSTGHVFAVAMLFMGTGAAVLGYLHASSGDLFGGMLVIYLVATAWLTIKRPQGRIGPVEYAAMVFVAAMAASSAYSAFLAGISEAGTYDGRGLTYHVLVAAVLGGWAVGDIRNILNRGLSGSKRLVRHLNRMCFAVFAAAGPIFIARLQVFPDYLSQSPARYALLALPFLPLLVMPYWLVRLRGGRGSFPSSASIRRFGATVSPSGDGGAAE